MMIKNMAEAEAELAKYMPRVKELLGKDITLERMQPMLDVLDHPEKQLKIIHVAGTSGKTSTAYYISSLLVQAGQKVGLTVSPHMDSVTERLQINLKPLSEKLFCETLGEFLELIKNIRPEPTYFELIIGLVFWYFAKAKVDYAVIETGLGGLHDATNAARQPDKICVITDIGYDHMHVLGNNLEEIAGQKAGIIHSGNQVFMYKQADVINQVIKKYTRKQNAILSTLSNFVSKGREAPEDFNKLPLFQQRNWQLARQVYDHLQARDHLPLLSHDELIKSFKVQVPGRMEIIKLRNKTLIMDGAHNEQKMSAFVKSFQTKYPNVRTAILLALKQGKEFQTVLPLLKPICSRLIITSFDVMQDLPTTSISPEKLADSAESLGFIDVSTEPDPLGAYQKLMASTEDTLIITGSFYLLSYIRVRL